MFEKNPATSMPAIILLSQNSPFHIPDDDAIIEKMAGLQEPDAPDAALSWHLKETENALGEVTFGKHRIRITSLPAPIPSTTVNRTINVSTWNPQLRAIMRLHQSHLICAYQGEDANPIQQMTSLYMLAHALEDENLTAIVNENAWTAHPPADYLSAENIKAYQQHIPFHLWIGYVKFFTDKQRFWFVSKGHHLFDVPDLAYFIQADEKPSDIMPLFINIFYYLFENDVVVTPGDTMEISGSDHPLRFSEVKKYEDFLMGPSGTLGLEKIRPDEINR